MNQAYQTSAFGVQVQPQAPPPPYQATLASDLLRSNNAAGPHLSREEKYRDIVRKYEISDDFSRRLQLLQGFKVVFILDDSGSMNSPLQESPLNAPGSLLKVRRWDELQYFVNISIEVTSIFDSDGCDVYFLNRIVAPVRNVRSPADLAPYFVSKPEGFTPLPRVLNSVLDDNRPERIGEKKLLILIATDGEPTNDEGKVAIPQLKNGLLSRNKNVYTTVVVCTDDDDSVSYLNKWDRTLPRLDVVDDYRSERTEIRKAKGAGYSFSFGDYVVKSLIGSIDPELDQLDENSCKNCAIL